MNSVDDKCDNCGTVFRDLKNCSKCKKAKYCSKKCQFNHWQVHKSACKMLEAAVKPVSVEGEKATFRPFPLARYWYDGDFRFYYAYGNTVAEDFLQNCSGDIKVPQILSLGCGDIRSCFYTLWKHFNPQIPERFKGVHFLLNDCSSPVQARNTLFLYLCLQLPKENDKRREWLSGMWAIWYCHELYPQHKEILNNSLKELLQHSSSLDQWTSSTNPLCHLVSFTSQKTLHEISYTWKMWLESVISVQQMQFARCFELKSRGVLDSLDEYTFSYSLSATFINGDHTNDSKVSTRQAEVVAYIQSGSCYAETVLSLNLKKCSATFVNATLYERPDGVYSLHYGSVPFSGYYHTYTFVPGPMQSAGVRRCLCDMLLVSDKSFTSFPFLANSVQQFAMWVQSAANVLTTNKSVSFSFSNDHAISFCQDLQHDSKCKSQFDVIYTSNLMDHLGPPNVVLTAIQLLKEDGLLFTTTLLYKNFVSTLDEYISMCFGLDCKLLPIVLGIRCINHEGAGYSSIVTIDPVPVSVANMLPSKQHNRTLIWENVSAQPFILSALPPLVSGNITDALFDSIQAATFSLMKKATEGKSILNNMCIETAILVLQKFSSQLSKISTSYQFWEPVSTVFRQNMKPFLNSMQTQLLLHKMHIHLTVTENTCPVCKHTPLQEHVGLFRAKVLLPLKYLTPHFLALLHCYASSDSQYLCKEALSGKNVHIFDCIDGDVQDNCLLLKFFAPLEFVSKGYNVTIALSCLGPEKNLIVTCLPTTDIRDLQVDFQEYSFLTVEQTCSSAAGQFGELTSHVGDERQICSEIKLSGATSEALKHHKLKVNKVSSTKLKILCETSYFELDLNYPIDYDKVSVKIYKSQQIIKLICPRQSHNFWEDKSVLIALPDHELTLPPHKVSDEIVLCHSGMQKNKEERQLSNSCNRDHALMTPLINVKESVMFFFQLTKEFYFRFTTPEMITRGYVVVNQRLFDYQCRAPAIDLAFCFPDLSNNVPVAKGWIAILGNPKCRAIIVDDAEYQVLHKTLIYFGNRTDGTCQSAALTSNRYQELCKENIDQYFTRAVIYLLYCDADLQGINFMNQIKNLKPEFAHFCVTPELKPTGNPSIDKKCDYCAKYSPVIKKCTKCKHVQYCSKECQTKHWPAHSTSCKAPLAGNSAAPSTTLSNYSKCNFCGKMSGSLKKCKQCGEAQYCNKECQVKHWPRHKLECKPTLPTSVIPNCAYCRSSSAALKACTRCAKVKYCGKECQTKDWKKHKESCA